VVKPGAAKPNVVKRQQGAGGLKGYYLALAAVVLVGGGLLVWQLTKAQSGGVRLVDDPGPAQAEGYLYGRADAPVQVVEFADFQCPACANFSTITEPDVRSRIIDAGLANMRFYDYPLPQHQNSVPASMAAACAADQGKFWEMHDRIFEGQPDWSEQRNPAGTFRGYARDVGLNVDAWGECYSSGKHQARIEANRKEGERRGVSSTPTFIIGRRLVPGALNYDTFKAYVDSARADAVAAGRASPAAPAESAPPPPPGGSRP
jgi:protein-disulfide isomerase